MKHNMFTADGILVINIDQLVKAEPLDNNKDIAFYFNDSGMLSICFRFNNEADYKEALNKYCKENVDEHIKL